MGFKLGGSIIGAGLGSAAGGSLGGVLGGAFGGSKGIGGIKDLLLGGKSAGNAGGFSALDPIQQSALQAYSDELRDIKNVNPEQMARTGIANQERMARQGVSDAQKNIQQAIAQRGIGKSSVGLTALMAPQQGLNERLQQIRAQQPLLQQQYAMEKANRLNALAGGVNSTLDTRMYTMPQVGGVRAGGLLAPLLGIGGGLLGNMYGGPMGGVAGAQAGIGLGQSVQNMR